MITASTTTLSDFKQSPVDPRIRLGPSSSGGLVATTPFSLVQKGNLVDLRVEENPPQENVSVSTEALWEKIVSRSELDVERYPESARARVNLGLVLLNRGQLGQASGLFSEALERDPHNYVAEMALARIKMQQGDLVGARELYESLAKQYTDEVAPLFGLASVAMRENRFKDSERMLRDVLAIDGQASVPKYHLALVLLKMNQPDEAIRFLKAAARSEVRWPSVHHALGVAYAVKGDLKRAVRCFVTSLTLAPSKRDSVHALSTVLLRQGETEKAVQLLRNYLEKGGEDLEIRQILAQAFRDQKRYREARIELARVWGVMKDNQQIPDDEKARTLNNIGVCLAYEGKKEAEQYLEEAINMSPTASPLFYTNLARWLLKNDQVKAAQTVLVDAKTEFPLEADVRLLLSLSLRIQRLDDDAEVELRELIETGNAPAGVYSDLGWLLAEAKNDLKAARDILETGFTKFGQDLGVANNYAYVLLLTGDIERAKKVLETVPLSSANSVYLTATFGLLKICEGDLVEGRAYYQFAEKMAFQTGDEQLARIVRQKMHLELARAFLRASDNRNAWSEVNKGLQVRVANKVYRYAEDLEAIRNQLSDLDGRNPA